MRNMILSLVGFGLVWGMTLPTNAEGPAASVDQSTVAPGVAPKADKPALSKQKYEMIMAQLDAGGDLLVVANLEGLVKSAVEGLVNPILAMGENSPEAQGALHCVARVPGFLNKNGFYALQGFGMSVVPRSDGLYNVKGFVAREPTAAWLPLWRAMVGTNPKVMMCKDFLPADTELARTGTAEWKSLWNLICSGVVEIGTPAAATAFDSQLAALKKTMGIDLDKVFESFSGESFFSVQLSQTETIELPGMDQNATVEMPQPSLLMGIAVSDNSLPSALEAALAKSGMMVVTNAGELAGIRSIDMPVPLPIPLKLSYAVHSNVFLLGSTPEVVAAGIKAFETKGGLTATPQFKKAFEGLPAANNGLSYMSPRFFNTITEVQKTYLSQMPNGNAGMPDVMKQLLGSQTNMQSAMVFQNRKNGVLIIGNSSAGGKEVISTVMLAPVAMVAGMAIPSFMSARKTSTKNSCINNLRQLEAAKEQWALATKKNSGDALEVAEVLEYIKGSRMPICPQGGSYTLNVIGEDCKCSIPGHSLSGN